MINEQPITSTLKPARRTWRFQGFTDFGIDPKIEAFRERVFLTSDGQLDSREQLGQVSRTLSAFKDDQITLSSGKTLTELKSQMPVSVATPELRFQIDESRKFAVIDEVAARLAEQGAEVNATDGVRVKTPDGWWLLRASNPQDVLVARAEAKDRRGSIA